MYRLLATDIDDTLLASDGTLPEANRLALRALHDRGIAIVFSSGRADGSLRRIAAQIIPPADDEYLISFNGARVVTALSGNPIFEDLLTNEAVRLVAGYCRNHALALLGYEDETFVVESDGPIPRRYARSTAMEYRTVSDLAAALPNGSAKLLIIAEPETLMRHQPVIEELARTSAAMGGATPLFRTTFSKPDYLEIIRPGVDKGTAIRKLAAHLGIGIHETIAVGDSQNDSEMIAAAGLGVAVANAREELKAAADVVLDRTADEGAMVEIAQRFFPQAAVPR